MNQVTKASPRGASGVSYLSEAYNQIGIQGPRRLRHEKQQTPSVFGTESHFIGKRVGVHFFCIVVQMNTAFWVLHQGGSRRVPGWFRGRCAGSARGLGLCSVSALVMAVEVVMRKWKWLDNLGLYPRTHPKPQTIHPEARKFKPKASKPYINL